jgi:hypothetical protein
MFIAGVGAGLGLSFVVAHSAKTPPSQTIPWNDQPPTAVRTAKSAEPEQVPTQPPEPPQEAAPVQPAVKPIPPASDERWPARMTNSPVKRTLLSALDRIEDKQVGCRQQAPELAQELVVRVGFESVGGMATVTEVEAFAHGAVGFQGCLLRTTSQMLIDFPVEDGFYQVLWRLPAPENTEKPSVGK